MQVSEKEVIHIAKLADLNLSNEEVEKYRENLDEILNYVQIVNQAPIEGLEETVSTQDTYNVFRKDEIVECVKREELLHNAPEQQEGMFKIPKVVN